MTTLHQTSVLDIPHVGEATRGACDHNRGLARGGQA